MVKATRKLRSMGFATRTMWSRARSINANLRRRNDDKLAEVKRINNLVKISGLIN